MQDFREGPTTPNPDKPKFNGTIRPAEKRNYGNPQTSLVIARYIL